MCDFGLTFCVLIGSDWSRMRRMVHPTLKLMLLLLMLLGLGTYHLQFDSHVPFLLHFASYFIL